jgi:hypothetical protein
LENNRGNFTKKDVGLGIKYDTVREATAADYTGNGCLDLFVIQQSEWSVRQPVGYSEFNVTIEEDNGNPNRLFRGDCSSFIESTQEAGIRGEAWSWSASFVDFTNDGYPDIHVANDFNNDVLYINNGNGTFDRRVLPNFTNRNAMSSEVADINNDGLLDIFVTNIYHNSPGAYEGDFGGRTKGNNLLINQGNGSFVDVAGEYGVRKGYWGWSAELSDFNNDMSHDIYHATFSRNKAFFQRTGNSFRTVNSTGVLGNLGGNPSFGVVSLDHDRDGTLDIAETVLYRGHRWGFRLYENRYDENNWLQVAIDSSRDGRTTMGTRVRVSTGNVTQVRVRNAKSDYLSQSSRVLHFGLGNRAKANVTVRYPDGDQRVYQNIDANQRLSLPR